MPLNTIPKGLPFDVAPGGKFPQVMPAPSRLVYDSSAGSQYGAVYVDWPSVMTVAANFVGPVEIYIRNGSQIPAGSYTMPASWYLTVDKGGSTVPSGVYFNNSPIELRVEGGATLTFQESAGGSTFTLSNPLMTITGCTITLGTSGVVIDGTTNQGLRLRNVQVPNTSGMTLMSGSTNVVTALEQTVLHDNVLPASMGIFYDPTSHVNSQNGNTGVALYSTNSSDLPNLPGSNGTYDLHVASGVGTWVAAGGAYAGTPDGFVFQPGATYPGNVGNDGNLYTTGNSEGTDGLTLLLAALAAVEASPVTLYFDFSYNSNAYTQTGNWGGSAGVAAWVGIINDTSPESTSAPPTIPTLTIAGQGQLPQEIRDLNIQFNDFTGGPLLGLSPVLKLTGRTTIGANGGGAYIAVYGGGSLLSFDLHDQAVFGDGTNAIYNPSPVGYCYVNLYDASRLAAYAIFHNGEGAHIYINVYSSAATVDAYWQTRSDATITYYSGGGSVDASTVTYEPGTPADWATPPTQVAEALDELSDMINVTPEMVNIGGSVAGNTVTIIGDAAIGLGNASNDGVSIGAYNTATGASGGEAVAIGDTMSATGSGAVALGNSGTAISAAGAVSIGNENNANDGGTAGAVAIGNGNNSTGDGAVSIGDSNLAAAAGDVVLGYQCNGNGEGAGSVTAGNQCETEGVGSVALGSACQTGTNGPATGSVAIGNSDTANYTGDVAIGSGCDANGGSSGGAVAIGGDCDANGTGNVAIGNAVTNVGPLDGTVAIGNNCRSEGAGAVGIGNGAFPTGTGSVAIGDGNNVNGDASVGIGDGTSCTLAGDVAIGQSCSANGGVAIGANNNSATGGVAGTSIAIGNANTASPGVAVGDTNSTSADGAVAIGANGTAYEQGDVCIGNGAFASFGVALGNGAAANGPASDVQAVAICNGASSSGGVAIGPSCTDSSSGGAAAIGSACVTNVAGDVAIGYQCYADDGGQALGYQCHAAVAATLATGQNADAVRVGQTQHAANITGGGLSQYLTLNSAPMYGFTPGSAIGETATLTMADGSAFAINANTDYTLTVTVHAFIPQILAGPDSGDGHQTFIQKANVSRNTLSGPDTTYLYAVSAQEQFGSSAGSSWTMTLGVTSGQFNIVVSDGADQGAMRIVASVQWVELNNSFS